MDRERLPGYFGSAVIPAFLCISVVMLIMGIVYIPAANLFKAHNVENIIEWNFAFLMHVNYALVWILWRRQDLRLHLDMKEGSRPIICPSARNSICRKEKSVIRQLSRVISDQ